MADIIGKDMPDFNVTNAEGVEVKFSAFRDGKAVLVDFYTSWWGGCNGKAQKVEALAAKYKDNTNIKFLLVNIEKDIEFAKVMSAFSKKNELNTLTHMYGQAPDLVGLQFIPHCVLVSAEGKILQNKDYTDKAVTDAAEPKAEEEAKEEDATEKDE